MGLLSTPVGLGTKVGSGLLDEAVSGIKQLVKKAEDFLPWDEEVTYLDEATNGVITLAKFPDGRTSVIKLEVPEEFRGKGVAKKLQAQAMNDNPNLTGQVSSKKAATSAYNLGRRPISNPNATLEEVYAAIDDMSSVNMATPDAIKAFNSGASPVRGLLDMDTPSRMARAKEQGFDDRDFYHATGANIKEFDNSKIGSTTDEGWFGRGHYFTPSKDYVNQFVPSTGNANVLPVKIKADNQYDWRANETESQGRGMAIANDEMRQLKTDQIKEAGYTGVDVYDDVVQLGEDEVLNPKQWEAVKKYYVNKLGSFPQWLKKESVEKTLRKGSPKWEYLEIYGPEFVDAMPQKRILKERMIFDTKNIRSKFATFDPAKASSSNLLASNPVATTGAGLMANVTGQPSNLSSYMQGNTDAYLTNAERQYLQNKQAFESNFSDDTGWDRADILPFRVNEQTGEREFATPEMIKGLLSGLYDIGQSKNTKISNPASLLELI
jgi:hypothetical protein